MGGKTAIDCVIALFYLCIIGSVFSATCGINKNLDLKGNTIFASTNFLTNSETLPHAVDGYLDTAVETDPRCKSSSLGSCSGSMEENWIIISLGEKQKQHLVESVTVVPARPKAKKSTSHSWDKRDTKKCKFPFMSNGRSFYHCTSTHLRIQYISGFWCSYRSYGVRAYEISNCDGEFPKGILADNLEILLTRSKQHKNGGKLDKKKFVPCGKTSTGKYNADRKVKCSKIINANYIAIRKRGNIRFAEINVNVYSIYNKIVTPHQTWYNQATTYVKLKIDGCTPQFKIHRIKWFYQTFDKSERRQIDSTLGSNRELLLQNIFLNNSGSYYFTYINEDGSIIYESDSVRKRVHYSSKFSVNLPKMITGYENDTIDITCATDFGYPAARIEYQFQYPSKLETKDIICKDVKIDKYGGESMTCTASIKLEKSSHNSTVLCIRKQTGFPDLKSNIGVIKVLKWKEQKKKKKIALFSVIGIVCLVLIVLTLCCTCKIRKRSNDNKKKSHKKSRDKKDDFEELEDAKNIQLDNEIYGNNEEDNCDDELYTNQVDQPKDKKQKSNKNNKCKKEETVKYEKKQYYNELYGHNEAVDEAVYTNQF